MEEESGITTTMQDEVISHTEIYFDWMERLRILCGRPAFVSAYIKTENLVGCVHGRWECHVARIIPPTSSGGAETRLTTG